MKEPIEWWKDPENANAATILGFVIVVVSIVIGVFLWFYGRTNPPSKNEVESFFVKLWNRFGASTKVLKEKIDSLENKLQTESKAKERLQQEKSELLDQNQAKSEANEKLRDDNKKLDEEVKAYVGNIARNSHVVYNRFPKKEEEYKEGEEYVKKIKYGYVDYPPLLHCDNNDNPTGIGKEILEKLFAIDEIEPISLEPRLNIEWNEIETALYAKESDGKYKIDIIATPLFETKQRSKNMLFCSPIFYSEVGIYVYSGSTFYKKLLDEGLKVKSGFSKAIEKIINYPHQLKIVYIVGEISEKMVDKHLKEARKDKGDKIDPANKEPKKIPALINRLVAKGEDNTEIVFTEKYQAEDSTQLKNKTAGSKDGKVINILEDKALRYPVAFAVRKKEYALRNYINLKLLTLNRNCISDIIIKVLTRDDNYIHKQHLHPLVGKLKGLQDNIDDINKKIIDIQDKINEKKESNSEVKKLLEFEEQVKKLKEQAKAVEKGPREEQVKEIIAIQNEIYKICGGGSVVVKDLLGFKAHLQMLEEGKKKIRKEQVKEVETYFLPALKECHSVNDASPNEGVAGQEAKKS